MIANPPLFFFFCCFFMFSSIRTPYNHRAEWELPIRQNGCYHEHLSWWPVTTATAGGSGSNWGTTSRTAAVPPRASQVLLYASTRVSKHTSTRVSTRVHDDDDRLRSITVRVCCHQSSELASQRRVRSFLIERDGVFLFFEKKHSIHWLDERPETKAVGFGWRARCLAGLLCPELWAPPIQSRGRGNADF
jgi:hypothetical protein